MRLLVVLVASGKNGHVRLRHGVAASHERELDTDDPAVSEGAAERVRYLPDRRRVTGIVRRHRDDHPLQQLHPVVRAEHTLLHQLEVLVLRVTGLGGGAARH